MKTREWKVGVKTLEYYKDHSEMFEAEWKQALAENARLKSDLDEALRERYGLFLEVDRLRDLLKQVPPCSCKHSRTDGTHWDICFVGKVETELKEKLR